MKRSNVFRKIFSIVFAMAILATSVLSICGMSVAAKNKAVNKFNVVFALDKSESMKSTDPNHHSIDALELFVGLSSISGNYFGAVVFSEEVVPCSFGEINNKADKTNFVNDVKKKANEGSRRRTNIGGALLAAVNILEEKGNKDLPSAIILLTDGKTEMGNKKEDTYKKSINDKAEALEIARDKGYKIYTVGLNANEKADPEALKELTQIASATGGKSETVKNTEDIKNVFDMFYKMIYATQSNELINEKVPSNGTVVAGFDVAEVGVEEVNIVIFGKTKSCKITNPKGKVISGKAVDDISYTTEAFKVIKITDLITGKWKIEMKAEPGKDIKVFKIYNPNLNVDAKVENEDSLSENKEIKLIADVYEGTEKVSDSGSLKNYTAQLNVKNYKDEVVYTEKSSKTENGSYVFKFKLDNLGTYKADVTVETDDLSAKSNTVSLEIGNTNPVFVNEKKTVLKKHIWVLPSFMKTNDVVELSKIVTDNEDENLAYSVISSTWSKDSGDYELNGSQLKIKDHSFPKGSFEIRANDSNGGYIDFNVKITSTNVALAVIITIVVVTLLVLAVIGYIIYKQSKKCFMGEIKVTDNITKKLLYKDTPNQGKLLLKNIGINIAGIDPKAHFQATSKGYIIFNCKTPFTTSYSDGAKTKMDIIAGLPTTIYFSDESRNGITVLFNDAESSKKHKRPF